MSYRDSMVDYDYQHITREQCDVWWLAKEIKTIEARAMCHDAHAGVQRSRCLGGADPKLDWAITYLRAAEMMGSKAYNVLDRAHCDAMMTAHEERILTRYLRRFYFRVIKNGLYGSGVRWLHIVNQ